MSRPLALRLLVVAVPLALLGGTAVAASASTPSGSGHEVCALVWNDDSGPRDGLCVDTPGLPVGAPRP